MFTHILMTRFNLATPGKEFALRTKPQWLEGRFDLFERYCLPSVAAQNTRDFKWIIYFDIDTPQHFKDRVEKLREVFPFTPFYTGLFHGDGWRTSVQEIYAPNTQLLLTTRLDNDDALASDFMARLHDTIRAQNYSLGSYNFTHGVIRRGAKLYMMRHESNAFYSLLEPVSPQFRTAFTTQHMKIAESGPVFQIDGPPTWMQIIHETNVSNKVRGTRVVPGKVEATSRFGGAGLRDLDRSSTLQCALENISLGMLRSLRDASIKLVRRSS